MSDANFRRVSALHRLALRLTGGRLGRRAFGMTIVELHTVGRRSGQERTTVLSAPIFERGRIVLVASKGGADGHPDWYQNLRRFPDVELTIDGRRSPFRARTASSDEKAELWPRIVAAYQGYAGYQERTDRDIPVVICEARTSEAGR